MIKCLCTLQSRRSHLHTFKNQTSSHKYPAVVSLLMMTIDQCNLSTQTHMNFKACRSPHVNCGCVATHAQVSLGCGNATRNYNEEVSVYYTPHNNHISLLRQWRKSTKIALIDEPSSIVLTITIHRHNTTS